MASSEWTSRLAQRPKKPKGSFDFDSLSDSDYDTEESDFDLQDGMLVIGIDFGTTYSGAAWATSADFQADQVNLITRWPGTGREEGKVPTELFFENDEVTWGYDVPADSDPVRWFKLLLLKDEDLAPEFRASEYILRGRKMLRENEKTAVDLVADYLRGFWEHVLSEITKARGQSLIDALRFHVVITLPAIWKGYARQSMQEAATKAGILDERDAGDTTLSFAPEPEAAALCTLCEPGRRINDGDVYLICDAGGGTVDLISYEVEGVDPLTIREAAEGIGGLCGGIFIDEAFERICKNRLGRGWDRLSKVGIRDIMKGEWEHAIKPQFTVTNSRKEYIVSIPAEAFPNKESQTDTRREPIIKNGRIHFKEADLQKAFTGVFSDIEKLIDSQITSGSQRNISITGIILVGGLGSSPYLYDTLRAKYGRQHIDILQSSGMGPRTAISRGAVSKGFLDSRANMSDDDQANMNIPPVIITSTISRAHFGVQFKTKFEEGKHLEEDRQWDDLEERWKAKKQMHWYVRKGDDVSKSEPVRAEWYRNYEGGFGKAMKQTIYQCADEVAPGRMNGEVKVLCDIEWVPDVSFEELEWKTNSSGKRYKRLDYAIEFIPLGATAEFAVYIDGRKQKGKGSIVNIQYDS
ncbi:actin-like ATPase domain-containing protein [Hypoxylon sp. FL1857]|nr:actin-like ATPase domain-containing protein [Hypoxylon sp. FL1857]